MKKSILFYSLVSGTALMLPRTGFAADPLSSINFQLTPKFEFAQLDKAYKTAGVCFLGIGDCAPSAGFDSSSGSGGSGDEDFDLDTTSQCLNEGFTPQSCNSVQTIDGVCPYNSAYGRGCKCKPGLISCPAGQVGVGDSCNGMYASCKCDPNLKTCSAKENGQGAECGGKYESCVCKPEYQYDANNCTYPQSTTGDECGGKYTECVCPTGVDEGPYGCEEYYPAPCDSICKIAYSDNCHIRSDNTGPYGCEKVWDDCSSKCEKPYSDNCRNRTAVSTPYGCQSYFGDCSTKCEVAYSDNCRNRSDASCSYGCQSSWGDCSSKCQTCYSDNCRNRTAVISSCPTNASCSHFSDCSSKISSWSCKSGYSKSGSSCVKACTPDYSTVIDPPCGCYRWETIDVGCGETAQSCQKPKPCKDTSIGSCEPYYDPRTGRWMQCALK